MRTSWLVRSVLLVNAVPLLGACVDYHTAEECQYIGTCPVPNAGVVVVQANAACDGTCVPGVALGLNGPVLVRLADDAPGEDPTLCPPQASNAYYYGVAPPAVPTCGECTCQAPVGSCAFPETLTANTGTCAATGSGVPFDAPSPWDGTCTTQDALTGGSQSVTVAPLMLSESGCVPNAPEVPQDLPGSPASAQACTGQTTGVCQDKGHVCLPTPPSGQLPAVLWTYCIAQMGVGTPYDVTCPHDYPKLHVFADGYSNPPTCSPCTCGPAEGSACSSLVSMYSDSACSDPVGSVTALSSMTMCVDAPAASPLGSKTASPPVYEPGTCPAGGGVLTGSATPIAPWTYCCLK